MLMLTTWITVPQGEPLFDHVVLVRFVTQFMLRHQLTARAGVYVWLHDAAPSGLLWVQPSANATTGLPDLRTANSLALLANIGGQVPAAPGWLM